MSASDAGGPAWDGLDGSAGGKAFGAGLAALAQEREMDRAALTEATGYDAGAIDEIFLGNRRIGISALARFAEVLRTRPLEFLQKTSILSLESYAFGLDPLYFLPEGPVRYDARIYMREINPRHAVPERDMTKRSLALKAVQEDELLDDLGKTEVELAYLLRAAVQQTGGTL
jgi:transcriptional regulator with XRE-family HTH domain